MYYAITKKGVKTGITLPMLNKKLDAQLSEEEFRREGNDRVIQLTDSDLQFIQDKKTMSKIPIKSLYKKGDNNLILYIILALNFIILVRG